MKNFTITTLLLLCVLSANAQNHRLWGSIEIDAGYSINDDKDVNGDSFLSNMNNGYSSLQATLGYYITKDFSLGIGIGIKSYHNPSINIFPIFLNLRYHPFRDKDFVLSGEFGYPRFVNEHKYNDDAGFVSSISIGYKLCKLKKITLVPAIGYNYNHYSIQGIDEKMHDKHRSTIFIKLGFVY